MDKVNLLLIGIAFLMISALVFIGWVAFHRNLMPMNYDDLQVYSAIPSGIASLVLILATVRMATATSTMASATKDMAEQTKAQGEYHRIRQHVDSLTPILNQWHQQIENNLPHSPYDIHPLGNRSTFISSPSDIQPLHLAIEDDPLFDDLRYHTPKLLNAWEEYKVSWGNYEVIHQAFAQEVIEFLKNTTSWPIHDSNSIPENTPLLLDNLARFMVIDFYNLEHRRPLEWLISPPPGSQVNRFHSTFMLMLSNQIGVLVARTEEECQHTFDRIVTAFNREDKIKESMNSLQDEFNTLQGKKLDIARKIKERASVSLPPNVCPRLREE